MPVQLRPDDPRLTWQGIVELEKTPEWVCVWRLPHREIDLFPGTMLQERAEMPAGARISFYTTSTRIAGAILGREEACRDDASPIDLCIDGAFHASCPIARATSFAFDNLPPANKLVELWLPQFGYFRLRHLEFDDGATVAPSEDARPRWIAYGSSLTQCRNATSPTRTWPAIVARGAGLNHTNMGFNGECHLDPMVAGVMRGLAADSITLALGANIYGKGTLNERSLRSNLYGFVKILREGHPDAPILVMSDPYSRERERERNAAGLTMVELRAVLADCVETLRRVGDRHVTCLDGLQILGPGDDTPANYGDDGLHQTAQGIDLWGRRYLSVVHGVEAVS